MQIGKFFAALGLALFVKLFVLEPFGQVSISHANWDVTSFDAQSMLGTFPGDTVKISLNMTNPGGLPASSIFWIHFYSEKSSTPGKQWRNKEKRASLSETTPKIK